MLRISFPLAAGLLLLAVVLWQDFAPRSRIIGLEASSLPVSELDELTMVRPRFDGLDKEGQPYTLTAERANQMTEDGDLIVMTQPAADVTLTNGRWVAVSADRGQYFRYEERLDLQGNVSLFQDDGYEIRTSAVEVRLGEGTLDSDRAVWGQGPHGEMRGQGLRVEPGGKIVQLKGRARVTILPADEGM